MYDSRINSVLEIPIRLEDTVGAGITSKVIADLTVLKADPSDTSWQTVVVGNRSLVELGTGDYTLKIVKALIDERGFFRTKVSCTGAVDKQYVANILPADLNVYFKSTGDDTTGDGTFAKPYKSLAQCLTHINSRVGFTIHCLDGPANVAGNKDQALDFSVIFDGHGTAWTSAIPTNYHISIGVSAKNITIRNFTNLKIDCNPSNGGHKFYNCFNCEIVTGLFADYSIYEKCSFSNNLTGGGAESGRHSVFRDITFLGIVNFAQTFDGAIFDTIRFQSDLIIGTPVQYCDFNNITVRGNLSLANDAFNGRNVFRNIHVHGNVTGLTGKNNVFMGGVIRGNLNLDTNSINNLFWQTMIRGTVADSGGGNEIINYDKFATSVTALAIKSVTDKITFNAANYVICDIRKVNDVAVTSPNDFKATISALLTKAAFKDTAFNRNVTQRHPAGPGEDKPKTILIGAGGAEGTVATTIDGDGNLVTEVIS